VYRFPRVNVNVNGTIYALFFFSVVRKKILKNPLLQFIEGHNDAEKEYDLDWEIYNK